MGTSRRVGLSIAALAAVAAGCGQDAEAEVPPAGGDGVIVAEPELPIPAPPEGIAASHGGTIVAAGPYPMEVVARPDGEVEAWFVGAPPPDPVVSVRVPTAAGPRPVVLIWDPERGAHRGIVRGGEIAPGPFGVRVVVAGRPHRGRGRELRVVRGAPGAEVVVVGPEEPAAVVVEPAPVVVVEHPSPPRPVVVVEHPSPPRPVVVVEHPSPPRPVVVVEHPSPPRPVVVVEGPRPRGRVVHHGPRHGRRVRVHHRRVRVRH